MLNIIFKRAIEEYKSNIKVMLSFGILFLFLLLFIYFEQFFLASGTVLLSYNLSIFSFFGFAFALLFLFVFSFFIALTVYSVKRDVQKTVFDDYWRELLRKVSLKIFWFYFLLIIVSFLLFELGYLLGNLFFPSLIVLILFSLLMYVPQSIILDENSLRESLYESVYFWILNPRVSLAIVLFGSIAVFVFSIIELLLDLFLFPGIIVSFILTLIFLVPFMEQTKSYAFVLKFNLIKQPEVLAAKRKPKPQVKINAVRLREKVKGGKI
jgi:hypothetical protein